MFIPRDITSQLMQEDAFIQVMLGPRQCGKSTLLASLATSSPRQELTFDDLALRQLANQDPALFLAQFPPPLLLDEVQYAPNLFPEIKKQVDHLKRQALHATTPSRPIPLFQLTGSNQILMDKNVKESLAGRASYYYLNTLSVHEILQALPNTPLKDILFQGGWPALYSEQIKSVPTFLNNYIRSYVEKDIVLSAGIQKIQAFHTVLGLLAARTGQLLDYSEIAKASGVRSVTIKEWVGLLERADLLIKLPPFHSNLNKRLTKTAKYYFLDTGLATRLQGWSEPTPLLNSPQAGHLFETLVLAEIVKFIRNKGKDWRLYLWRTKEGEEIDFLLETTENHFYAFEAKLSIQGTPIQTTLPPSFKKYFKLTHPLCLITFGGQSLQHTPCHTSMPLSALFNFLQQIT